MKATLEFNLPEEEYLFRASAAGPRLLHQLDELRQLVRLHLKHGDPKDSTTRIEEIRDLLHEALMEFEV